MERAGIDTCCMAGDLVSTTEDFVAVALAVCHVSLPPNYCTSFRTAAPFNLLTLSGPRCPLRDATRLSQEGCLHTKEPELGCIQLGLQLRVTQGVRITPMQPERPYWDVRILLSVVKSCNKFLKEKTYA